MNTPSTIIIDRPHMPFPDDPHVALEDGKKIFGGSFFQAPTSSEITTINLMKEYPLSSDIYIPVLDFSTPENPWGFVEAFNQILASDKDVYVGCFGGRGRTGLFMSCLLRYMGHPDPIREVRRQYNEGAVETQEQVDFVYNFPVAPAPRMPMRPR